MRSISQNQSIDGQNSSPTSPHSAGALDELHALATASFAPDQKRFLGKASEVTTAVSPLVTPHLARIAVGAFGFRHEARKLIANLTSHEPPAKWLSLSSVAVSAEIGGTQHDLCSPSASRGEFQRLAAQSLAVVAIVDHLLDDGGLSKAKGLQVLDATLAALERGTITDVGISQGNKAISLAATIHSKICQTPFPAIFVEAFVQLRDAAVEQVLGRTDLDHTARLGGGTMLIAGCLPYCYDAGLSPRFLKAAFHFGALTQLMDDVCDYEHDRTLGIATGITTAANPQAACKESMARAANHLELCLTSLTTSEAMHYRAFTALAMVKWRNAFFGQSPTFGQSLDTQSGEAS